MAANLLKAFLASDDTLRKYVDKRLAFSSTKDRLLPLMEYIANYEIGQKRAVIYDKVMGNAAALLAVKANAGEVFSPLGSELARQTLDRHGVKYRLDKTVPYIMRDDGKGLCPMEQLSINKEPEEFYREMKARIEASNI